MKGGNLKMSLMLNVTSSDRQALHQEMKFEFNKQGGTIGRRLSNSWVLPDENRHLSGTHATIEYVSGNYFIIDTSTNGVFLNGDAKPLGNGERQELKDGFQLTMGTYTLQVKIAEKSVDSETLEKRSNDLFADLDDDSSSGFGSDDEEFLDVNESVSLKEKNKLPPIEISSDDPFYQFGEFTVKDEPVPKKNSKGSSSKSHAFNSHFKPAKIKQISSDTDFKKPSQDSEVVGNNKANEADSSVIPDDWNNAESSFDNLLSGIDDPFKRIENQVEEDAFSPLENKLEKDALPMKEKGVEKIHSENNNGKTVDIAQKKLPSNNSSFLSAFIAGLGLDEKKLESQLTEKDLFLAGKLLRTAVQGTMEVLQSRAEIKNEMRMDMTTIQPIQNNPIKFALNIEEVLTKLLVKKNKSYMNPEQAMEESYDDIKSHQVAVISGIQASLAYVLKRFEPETLIERLEKESPISANIPVHRQAMLWSKFEELYDAIESEAEDDFNRLFGQEFAKAYDEQVRLLKKARTK
jgi:type VI secretion system protein